MPAKTPKQVLSDADQYRVNMDMAIRILRLAISYAEDGAVTTARGRALEAADYFAAANTFKEKAFGTLTGTKSVKGE